MQKSLVINGVVGLLLFAMFSIVAAQTNDTNTTTGANVTTNVTTNATSNVTMGNETETEKNKTKLNQSRCESINNRVEGRLRQYNEDRDMHYARFDKFRNRLVNISDMAEGKGFNVTDLDADIAILDTKIAKLKTDYALFIDKLAETRNYTCGHSEGEFKAALQRAKDQLNVVREDAKDIKNFFTEVIKEDLKALKEQRRETIKQRMNETREGLKERKAELANETREKILAEKERLAALKVGNTTQ